ncbi:predicted protein [Botrytis cinerea T4]|uniref:Uncharacterized protein n=1 Tax=Botryotinia fuckeliana (strain T4) TaxID=999810 RepID=G2YAU5_BOTF4|nr:predicted protein [Botrytis cinerea T4]
MYFLLTEPDRTKTQVTKPTADMNSTLEISDQCWKRNVEWGREDHYRAVDVEMKIDNMKKLLLRHVAFEFAWFDT